VYVIFATAVDKAGAAKVSLYAHLSLVNLRTRPSLFTCPPRAILEYRAVECVVRESMLPTNSANV